MDIFDLDGRGEAVEVEQKNAFPVGNGLDIFAAQFLPFLYVVDVCPHVFSLPSALC